MFFQSSSHVWSILWEDRDSTGPMARLPHKPTMRATPHPFDKSFNNTSKPHENYEHNLKQRHETTHQPVHRIRKTASETRDQASSNETKQEQTKTQTTEKRNNQAYKYASYKHVCLFACPLHLFEKTSSSSSRAPWDFTCDLSSRVVSLGSWFSVVFGWEKFTWCEDIRPSDANPWQKVILQRKPYNIIESYIS